VLEKSLLQPVMIKAESFCSLHINCV
jgi:hypothetical protein